MTTTTPHPHFDDRGTLSWHTTMAQAKEEAARDGKLIFIELGRKLCSQCRALVETTVPRPDVGPKLQEGWVALAADADECEDEVVALAQKLEDAMMLPFVLFTDADGTFLDGYAGVSSAPKLIEILDRLTASKSD
tara:strand:- start:7550 stop:7954 length:405 start_codon:yes stop_codon:yes gene_type:complete